MLIVHCLSPGGTMLVPHQWMKTATPNYHTVPIEAAGLLRLTPSVGHGGMTQDNRQQMSRVIQEHVVVTMGCWWRTRLANRDGQVTNR